VSMATFAARRLADMSENTTGVLAVEYLAAAQGLDFRAPLKSTAVLESAKALLRAEVSFYQQDRYFGPDIEKSASLIRSAALNQFIPGALLSSF